MPARTILTLAEATATRHHHDIKVSPLDTSKPIFHSMPGPTEPTQAQIKEQASGLVRCNKGWRYHPSLSSSCRVITRGPPHLASKLHCQHWLTVGKERGAPERSPAVGGTPRAFLTTSLDDTEGRGRCERGWGKCFPPSRSSFFSKRSTTCVMCRSNVGVSWEKNSNHGKSARSLRYLVFTVTEQSMVWVIKCNGLVLHLAPILSVWLEMRNGMDWFLKRH